MAKKSRRDFLALAGVGALAGFLYDGAMPREKITRESHSSPVAFTLGIASYSFRAFPLDQAIAMTKRLGIKKLALKDVHMPLTSSEDEIRRTVDMMKAEGIELSSCGVVYMTNEGEVNNAFRYAKAAGLSVMVGCPSESLLKLVERMVKQTGIALAIHNHGPTDNRYPSPESAYRLIEGMDNRMGLCIDVGHTRRLGLDPAHEVERFADRLLDVHMKDVSSADAGGKEVEIGRGVIDIPELLSTLARVKYSNTIHFEYEKDEKDPLPGLAESVGYVRGIIATM
ncbi:MAG TPA: TIM barrel protein [Bacteroidota bacterium]|nr:TIM barrel protein [Bacteroidota bacterium]